MGGTPQKALFITHDTTLYGASRSLQTLLNHYSDTAFDLVVNKRMVRKNDVQEIRRRFGDRVGEIMEFYLPFDLCYKGKDPNTALVLANRFFWARNRKRFYRMLRQRQYTFIHLNSLILHPLITEQFPFVLHVREIYDGSSPAVLTSFKKATGVIFIDEATKAAFPKNQLPFHTVLNNPFDMTGGQNIGDLTQLKQFLGLENKTVFSIIGTVIENKGVDFVIRAFRECRERDIILLIVGRSDAKYLALCKELAGDDKRIRFYGEEPEISKIYGISDFIVRGEAYPCIGRTIYEGLYSGCKVIVPGEALRDRESFFDFGSFQDRIFFYEPRNLGALVSLLEQEAKNKVQVREYSSNLPAHLSQFQAFVNEALERRQKKGKMAAKILSPE